MVFSASYDYLARRTGSYRSTCRVSDVRKELLKDANPPGSLCADWYFLLTFLFTSKIAWGTSMSRSFYVGNQKGNFSKIPGLTAMKR